MVALAAAVEPPAAEVDAAPALELAELVAPVAAILASMSDCVSQVILVPLLLTKGSAAQLLTETNN